MSRISIRTVLIGAAFMASSTAALAADPMQADFDACNRMAQSTLSSPSASPQSQPPTGAKTPQAAPSPEPASEARVKNQADQLHGIADASKDDPTYRRAYLDCMKKRGF